MATVLGFGLNFGSSFTYPATWRITPPNVGTCEVNALKPSKRSKKPGEDGNKKKRENQE